MGNGTTSPVLRSDQVEDCATRAGECSDAQLLERFAAQRDERAFAALLERHGPMVMGVCRRVLQDYHAAEDAFQATFLVLARRAPAIAQPELLGNWLYGVAYRTAVRAKLNAARRSAYERQAAPMLTAEPTQEVAWREMQAGLDEERNRLPEKYRAPLVLCYLEGRTNEEAARKLGCPTGSMSGRLSRGRELLRKRLTRRGVLLSAGLLAALLSPARASAAVSAVLAESTVQAALIFAAGKVGVTAGIATRVTELANQMLHALWARRLKRAIVVGVVLALMTAAGSVLAYDSFAPSAPTVSSGSSTTVTPTIGSSQDPGKAPVTPAGGSCHQGQ